MLIPKMRAGSISRSCVSLVLSLCGEQIHVGERPPLPVLTKSFVVVDIDPLQLQVTVSMVTAIGADSMLITDDLPELEMNRSSKRSMGVDFPVSWEQLCHCSGTTGVLRGQKLPPIPAHWYSKAPSSHKVGDITGARENAEGCSF